MNTRLLLLSPQSFTRRLRHQLLVVAAAVFLPLVAQAQLVWSVYNETSTVAAPASTSTNGVVVTVPAGQRVTLVATNFVPVDLTAAGTENYTTINFKVSGGLTTIASGTRAVGFGLFNNNASATNYADDSGYFTWLNGRTTGSLIEQRRRIGDGTSPSLLNATGTAVVSASTGQSSPTPGSMSDGNFYAIQLHLMGRSGSVSFGNTSSNTTGGGVWLSGPGISAITYSNPDTPASAFVFNEVGFMFLNTTASDVKLTIGSVTGLTPINPPVIATQPAAISLNPGQAGILAPVITGTTPLTYQWSKGGTAIAGATAATYSIASAATADGGSYTVTATNAYGTVTSNAAVVTITSSSIPATITNQPASATVGVGASASFSVGAYGSSPLTYQWSQNGTAIAGATSATYSLASVTAANAGNYTVVVTSGTGTSATTVTSAAATLTVNVLPVITTQPASVTPALGQTATLSVVATGSPAPTYQWFRNGVPLAGATSPTLTLTNIAIANAGSYTVAIINDAGAVTSSAAVVAIPSAMVVTAVSPANSATGVNIDTPLYITFDRPPVVGNTGRIRIFKAADDTVVDTIDLGLTLQQRTVGTNATLYNFRPVTITGNTAKVYVHAGVLAYGQAYYVQMEQSTFLDSTGASFLGILDKNTWRFTTKAAGTATATAITVAADGSGDFTTVQGAIDSVPAGNTQRVVITVKKGTYDEIVYIGATRPFITIHGEDRTATIVGYYNNNTLNGTTATRAAFSIAANDSVLETITIRNTTPQGGSQAEAVFTGAQRVLLNRVNLLSRQDTLLTNTGTAFITDSYIEGNTDFMWGTAAVYFSHCELKALDTGTATEGYYTQVRNTATGFGNVYVNCKLTAAPGVVGTSTYYLGRIDPTPGNFPYSQCMYINCAMGAHISPLGWLLGTSNNVTSTTVQYWEYQSTDLSGATLDVSKRISSSRQLSDAEATLWSNPAFVLSGWVPQIAPTIETSPVAQSVTADSTATLSVVANGYPVPSLQWFKNGVAIPGATGSTLLLSNVQAADGASYTVTAASALGSATSAAGTLTVSPGKYGGAYFGTAGTGTFALFVRDDGTGVFLSTIASASVVARNAFVNSAGAFNFATPGTGGVVVQGTIDATGKLTGTIGIVTLTGTLSATGTTQTFAGYYQTGASNGAAAISLVIGAGGQAFALVQNGATLDAGTGTVDATGAVAVRTTGGINLTATVAAGGVSASASYTPATGAAVTTVGLNDTLAVAQRLREFSMRAQVTPTTTAAAGFVVSGTAPDNVLVRAIGPTLGDVFAVAGALSNPRLDLYRGSTLVASNVGWTTSNQSGIALASAQVGAFPLRTAVADSALQLTLPPGAYTAVMSSANGATTGVGLIEVIDVTSGAAGQRLVSGSAIGTAGAGANTLIAGIVLSGTQPKRMLIRAAGPGLAAYGVTGALAKPILTLYRGSTLVAQNTGWTTSADAPAITTGAIEAGDFAFAAGSADSALLINLPPGLYTVQVTSADGSTGTALIEFYELP